MRKKLVLFDLDNTLLEGDSDYFWAQHLIEEDRNMLDQSPNPHFDPAAARAR